VAPRQIVTNASNSLATVSYRWFFRLISAPGRIVWTGVHASKNRVEPTNQQTDHQRRTNICISKDSFTVTTALSAIAMRTRNSAIADKPRDAFRDINLRKISWPWNWGYRSLNVVENYTIWYTTYDFLLKFHGNCGTISCHYLDTNVEKCRDLEIRVRGHSVSLQVVPFDRWIWFPISVL